MNKIETQWLVTYFVYNNTYYDLKAMKDNGGKLPKDYFSMEKQTRFLINQIDLIEYSSEVTHLIIKLDIGFKKKANEMKAIVKTKDGFKLVKKFFYRSDSMASESSIDSIFNAINFYFKYAKIVIMTYGHGSIFGINYTEPSLAAKVNTQMTKFLKKDELKSLEVLKYYKTLLQKRNENFFKPHISKSNRIIIKSKNRLQKYANLFFTSKTGKRLFKDEDYELHLNIRMLSNREFKLALEKRFKIKKVDILVMYNCLMQNIYTQYDLSKNVEQLVAASSGIGMPGFNYVEIFNSLNLNLGSSNRQLADLFLTTIPSNPFYQIPEIKERIDNQWMVARFELDNAKYTGIKDNCKNLFSSMADILKKSDLQNEMRNVIKDAKRDLYNISSDCVPEVKVLDFEVLIEKFIEVLIQKSNLPEFIKNDLEAKAKALKQILNSIDRTLWVNDDFYGKINTEFYSDRTYQKFRGIGILLPIASKQYFEKYKILNSFFIDLENKIDEPDFIKETFTKELVRLLCKRKL